MEEKQDLVFIAPTAKILVVDDTPLNLAIAKALFKPMQMNIETAGDGYNLVAKNP